MQNVTGWLLIGVLLSGLTTTVPSMVVAKQNLSESVTSNSVLSATTAPSVYASNHTFQKSNSNPLHWKGGNITLTTTSTQREDVPAFEQHVIQSIVVTQGKQQYTMQTSDWEDKLLQITSVAASDSKAWIAIQAERSAGSSLILLNLETGEWRNLQDRLHQAGQKNVETITAYAWAPSEDQVAFSYGDTSKSTISIYNAQQDRLMKLPRTTNYITTSLILWQKDGTWLDYISEYPSDQFILYRYTLASNKVKPVKKMKRQESQEWIKLNQALRSK
ncbi:hypothetical protein [Paenibacillus xylanexedens]|uniref:hypothetical protein n=1 Tax=Paenibacillus xylanexedens TaxID=528191 RepID=UPI00119EF4E5|nr:hypothetical protein [Paenibacillus xylanexedens]